MGGRDEYLEDDSLRISFGTIEDSLEPLRCLDTPKKSREGG
jgi:hypothetical protein